MHHPVVRWSCVLKVIVALGQKIKLMNLSLDSPIRIDYESRVFNRNLFIFYMITPKWINFQVKANWNRPNTRLFRSDLLNFKLDFVGQKQFWLFFRSLQLFFPLLSAPAPSTDWTKLYRGERTRSIWVSSLSPIFRRSFLRPLRSNIFSWAKHAMFSHFAKVVIDYTKQSMNNSLVQGWYNWLTLGSVIAHHVGEFAQPSA